MKMYGKLDENRNDKRRYARSYTLFVYFLIRLLLPTPCPRGLKAGVAKMVRANERRGITKGVIEQFRCETCMGVGQIKNAEVILRLQ